MKASSVISRSVLQKTLSLLLLAGLLAGCFVIGGRSSASAESADQTAFSTLHGDPSDPVHSENDFSILKYCKNLMALDVGHNIIRDVSFLYDLPKLRVLILACNCITDITPVGSLKDLEYLEIFWNQIGDISPLTGRCMK